MRIYIPNKSSQNIGGGFTFRRNLIKGLKGKAEIVDSLDEADVLFITGITMVEKEEVFKAKEEGKKVILRIDGIPKNSRNKRMVAQRIPEFSKYADIIVFQSKWAKDYVGWWIENEGVNIKDRSYVVYNGVDIEVFNDERIGEFYDREKRYLYIQFNRDENKRRPEAFYRFHKAFREDKEIELWLVGKFGPELAQKNFDFFAGESVKYFGIMEDPRQLAHIMKGCKYFLFSAFMDACSNTLLEAINCGCEPVGVNEVGGSKEVLQLKGRTIQDMAKDYISIL